ncbi:MAG: hypothetical protein WD772_06250 [Pseudohongiellaceae bacterium]
MSLRIIELNDCDVRVTGEEGFVARSPGFALLSNKGLKLGEAAEKQARLHPTRSFNKFWHQLSLEPLTHSMGGVRHHADLAYAHLLHLAELAGLKDDVMLAVPGNFTSHQLSILLGLAKQCPFRTIGVVDSALAAVAGRAGNQSLVYIDLQLHQILLSRFSVRDGILERDSVIQVPGVGSQNFLDLMMQFATSLFIQQCRFNPQHNAESEQQLYNELPSLLSQARDQSSSLMMELKAGSSVHQAKISQEGLKRKLNAYYQKIAQQLKTLVGNESSQVLVSQRLGEFPGFLESFADFGAIDLISPEELGRSCMINSEHIGAVGGELRFVTSLPFVQSQSRSGKRAGSKPENQEDPTHVLFEDWALPLGRVEINNRESVNGSGITSGNINLAVKGLPDYLGQLERRGNEVFILCGESGAFLNNEKIAGKRRLHRGDRLRFSERSKELSLIRVHDE